MLYRLSHQGTFIQDIEVDVLYITSNLSYHKAMKTRMFTYPPLYLLIFISKSQKYGKIIQTVLDIILWKLFIFLESDLGVFSHHTHFILGFSGGSDGKESTCNAEDRGLIPGLERSPGEGNDYPLQYSCLENFTDRRTWWATVHGVTESDTTERLSLSLFTHSQLLLIFFNVKQRKINLAMYLYVLSRLCVYVCACVCI